MDAAEFRTRGKEMVDFVADFLEGIREYPPSAQVQPGYLKQHIPQEAPQTPDLYEDLMRDVKDHIIPGVNHWQHPDYHAYFPTISSYPATLANMLSDTIGCMGFSWGTASEVTLVTLLGARSRTVEERTEEDPTLSSNDVFGKLVVYCSDQAHSSVERSCRFGAVRCHQVESDDKDQMRGDKLQEAITADRQQGLIPFYLVATLGTTASCSFDQVKEIGPICRAEGIWLHIDAAYAGSAFVCPEFRPIMAGVEFADSFNFNPHKWMLVNFECSALWFKDSTHFVEAFKVDPLYLQYMQYKQDSEMPDYRHWTIPLSRRFRALKLWFVMRLYGVSGIQKHIRNHVNLAHKFEQMVQADDRFRVTHEVKLGLVCFRLRDKSNEVNAELLQMINEDGRLHMIPSKSKDVYFLRFTICSAQTELADVEYAWKVIKELATRLLNGTDISRND